MHKIAYKHKSGEKYLTSPARNHIMKEKAEGSCSASEGKTMTRRKCILIAVLFAGSMLSIAAGCSRTKYEKLAAPQNFEMAWNDVLSWDEVEGADRYAVTVGDATYETSSPSIDLMDITVSSTSRTAAQGISVVPGDSFTLSVAAKSAGGEEYDSEPSEFSYTTLTAVYGFSAGELTFREIREPSTGLTASRKLIMPEKINGIPVNRIANFNELLLEEGISVLRLPNTLTETNVFFESKEGQPETPLRISLPSMMRETSEAFCGNLTRLHEVTFPATLTTLGTRAFYGCTSLDHVVLPAGLRTIEGGAFLGCTSLKDLSIEEGNPALRLEGGTNVMTTGERPTLVIALAPTVPEDAVALGAYVFSNVENAAEIALPAGLETIGDGAFAGASIERITFPDGLKEIGAYAFEGCTKLTSATLPPALKTVGASAFYGSALEEVTLPDGLEEIWEYAFANCRLKEVRLPSSITFVGNYSFGANPIEELTIEEGVGTIGAGAFIRCNLRHVFIPRTASAIGAYAFYANPLEEVVLSRGVMSIGFQAFSSNANGQDEDGNTYTAGSLSVVLPDTVTNIGSAAFTNATVYAPFERSALPAGWSQGTDIAALAFFGMEPDFENETYLWYTQSDIVYGCTLAYEKNVPYVTGLKNCSVEQSGSLPAELPYRSGYTLLGFSSEEGGEVSYPLTEEGYEVRLISPRGSAIGTMMRPGRYGAYLFLSGAEWAGSLPASGAIYAVWEKAE